MTTSTSASMETSSQVERDESSETNSMVTMIATPGEGSCGIGTYAKDLRNAFVDVQTEELRIDQDNRSVTHFVSLAFRAIASESDVVHIQHEYGLFRRQGSPYPGIMGLVFFPVLFLLNAFREKRIVVTLHSVLRPSPDEAPFRVRLYLLVMHKLIASGSTHVVFLSEECRDRFLEDIALQPNGYTVLPHGVNLTGSQDVSRTEAKKRFGFDPSETVIMIPGFIRPPKGHDIFIDVARALPEYTFFIAGGARPKGDDADFAAQIENDAPENVTVSGVLEEAEFPVALSAADLAFLPYRVVTQSGTFNWCAAQELPVLASACPYFERMEREWDNVETVELGDRDVLVDQIKTLIESDDRRRQLRENMRQYKEINSFRHVAKEHRRIYERTTSDDESSKSTHVPESTLTMSACSAQREDVWA